MAEPQASLRRLRCEVIGVSRPDDPTRAEWYAVETFRGSQFPDLIPVGTYVVLTAFPGEPSPEEKANPSAAEQGEVIEMTFSSVRAIATGLLRAYYHEVPASASPLPLDDPVEHLVNLGEILRGAVHDPQPTDIGNAVQLERERNEALREVGKARSASAFWEAEYRKASKWRKMNAERVRNLRREVRVLNEKLATKR